MASPGAGVWSTLGYAGLSYYWGVSEAEVDRLPTNEKARLTRLTVAVLKMPEAERAPIIARLEGVPAANLLSALQAVASDLSV